MITKATADAAKKAGATVKKKRALKKPEPKPAALQPDSVKSADLQRLRGEISQLRAELDAERKINQQRNDELSRIVTALSEHKPFRIKPVRNMDSKDPDYLLVSHYDFVPVSYSRKLDS